MLGLFVGRLTKPPLAHGLGRNFCFILFPRSEQVVSAHSLTRPIRTKVVSVIIIYVKVVALFYFMTMFCQYYLLHILFSLYFIFLLVFGSYFY